MVASSGRSSVKSFRGVAMEEGLTAKQLEQAAAAHFERSRLLGEVQRREAWNPVTFRNALDLLVRRGVVSLESGEAGRERERRYRRGEAEGDLSALHERLAAALRGL